MLNYIKNIFFLLFLFSPLSAQYKTNVHSISRREGLSNSAVNTIVKDTEGYIWFGTWNGVNRYDGNNIHTYLPGKSPNSIHNHVIREIYPDSASIWMLTNKGVALYDNIHDRFNSFFTQESEQINYENDISLSHSHAKGTWVSVFGSGIFQYDNVTKQFKKVTFDEASQQFSLGIKRLQIVNNQLFCINSEGYLLRMNNNHLEPVLKLPLKNVITSALSVYINKIPYLFITQRSGNAILVNLASNEFQPLAIQDDLITSFSVSRGKNRIWAGTEKGRLYSFNLQDRKFEIFKDFSGLLFASPIATRILSIYESEPDILWIGTDGNGVYTLKLTEFPNKSLASDQLSYPIVRCILVTKKNDVWVGTKGGGIDVFDSNGNHTRNISINSGLSNNSVLTFYEHTDGSVWVGTDGQGVDIISPDYRIIRNFPRDYVTSNPLTFGSVYRIIGDNDQRIYLGTSGFGVIMIELDSKKGIVPVNGEQLRLDNSGQQKQIVYALTQERPGIIWIGSRGLGLYRYNTITKRVIGQYNTTTHPGLILNDDILSLFSNKGLIWAGSSSGLFNISVESGDLVKVNKLNTQSDILGTSIHAMQLDQKGNLWVTTNQGLSSIDSSKRNVRSFNVNDGLINFEYSDGASFFDQKSNRLFVGGTMGVDIIQTDEIQFASYFPPIAINQLLIRNQPVEPGPGSVLSSRINHQKTLKLKYNQNSFTFYVSPLAFWGQERHRISYRLKNFDEEWIVNPPNQPISFSNLEPDNYILQIRVSDENGNWSPHMREIGITIDPPFWRTAWAIAGYILLVLGIQLLIFLSYRRRAARKKELALQEFRMQKDAELQNYKIEFFTNVAHEFRTPLTLITSHIHALLEDTRNALENPRLLKIFNNSIKLQKLVLEIMQFRKLEKGKEPLNIVLAKPVELLREVVSDLEMLAEQKNIRFEIEASDPELTFKTDADKFQRILTNLISNAIKYNKPGGFVKAFVSANNSNLVIEIEDSGIGIKPEYFQKVFEPFGISSAKRKGSFPGYRSTGLGLAVTRGLVELLKGTINFESTIGEGTRFTCVFPDVHQLSKVEQLIEPVDEINDINFIDETEPDSLMENSETATGKAKVLVVDDDPEILKLLKDLLHKEYHLIFAENGQEAYTRVLSELPDIVVSDVMMPEMDGIELCFKLRENFETSHLPIILLTAKAEIEDRISGLKAGADSYIPKPFHPEHLKVRIEKLLQLWNGIKVRFSQPKSNPTLLKEITDPFFQKMLDYIDENLDDENLSAEKLCDKLAISKSSLYNKTKSLLDTTPHGLINQRRLQKAAILLQSTNMTVSEIIDQTGFASRTYFYDLFHKSYDCSPSDYRNRAVSG